MEKYRLGLDLGTNSIGWAALALNEDDELSGDIIDMGVRLFSDGREPKSGEPLNEARRIARGIRKNLLRRKLRRRRLFVLLQKEGLFPTTKADAAKIKLLNPYELRVKALDEKLSPYELGRTLFHLGVRRGFKSNRKDNPDEAIPQSTDDSKKSKNATQSLEPIKMKQGEKCLHLENTIKESGYRTLGEFLWKEQNKNGGTRFVADKTTYYPTRKLYENEFDAIREKQKEFFPYINWAEIHKAIFDQGKLKPQERGRCQFMLDKKRTFKAMPCSHRYRILQEVYNLQVAGNFSVKQNIANIANVALFDDGEKNTPTDITQEMRERLIKLLDTKKEITFDKIRKEFRFDENIKFNLETDARTKLNGNTTAVMLRGEKYFGTLWDTFSLEEQDSIVEKLITADEDAEVEKMLSKYTTLSAEQKNKILRATFTSGTTSFCKELTEKLVQVMSEKHLQYDKALILLGYDHSDDSIENHYDILPYYGKVLTGSTMGMNASESEDKPEKKYGKIANPTVHVALNQLRVVVNALIKRYGKPAQIVVELSRDLKASREAKDAIQKTNAKRAKENQTINKNITDMSGIQYPNRQDRLKFRLWEELGAESMSRRCIYCGQNISAAELFTKNIEIEHILPFSRTLLDSESNKTLAHAHCNAKKGEHTPFEAFGAETSGQYAWAGIMQRVSSLRSNVKKKRFAENAIAEFEKDSSFINRQLTDNAYLSKIARRYLTCIMDKPTDVWTVAGGATKLMRDKWEIDKILKRQITEKEAIQLNLKIEEIGTFKKNRYDHRHHALDAVVIAQTDRSMVKKIADANARGKKHRLEMPQMIVRKTALVERVKNIVPSFKPDHGWQGQLHKETLLAKLLIQKEIDISKISEEDVENICDIKIKEYIKSLIGQGKTIKDIRQEVKLEKKLFVYEIIYASRKKITDLGEENFKTIIDTAIRNNLTEFVKNSKKKVEEAVLEFSKINHIKTIRCKNKDQTPICIPRKKNNPFSTERYYGIVEYPCVVIWKYEDKKGKAKYEGQFIRYDEFSSKGEIPNRPKEIPPTSTKICVLYKDDYLEFSEDNIWKKGKITKLSKSSGRIGMKPIFATNDIREWYIATNEMMIEKGWENNATEKLTSINVLFGEKSARRITVDPIGKVHRKKS